VPIDRDATLKRAEKLVRQGKLDAAIAEYVRLTSAHPGDWNSLNALGDLYLRVGQTDQALVQFARAGEQLVAEGALARAAAIYKKILRIGPGDPRGTRGLELIAEKQDTRAVRKTGPPVAPDDPDARMQAARDAQDASDVRRACALLIEAADLYEAQGKPADALAAVAEASSIEPANAEYRRRLLKMLIAQGELMQARCVARVVPELVMVADALALAGRAAEAADTIAEAALVDPGNRLLRERGLRQFVASGEIARARSLAETPEDVTVVVEALHRENRRNEALDVAVEAVERKPHDTGLRAPLVTACLANGDIDRAREVARTSADWMLLADALRRLDRHEDALAAMHEATQRDPHDATLHAAFVRACLETGDLSRARDEARTKSEMIEVADALDRLGQSPSALQMRADALRRDPEDPELRLALIRGYMAAGQRDRAHALLTIDVAGDDVNLVLLLARLEFGIGRLEEARRALNHLCALPGDRRGEIAALGRELLQAREVDAAFVCVDLVADAAVQEGDCDRAVSVLQDFVARTPHHIPALLKLIEICVEGGFKRVMAAAQEQLADAYLRAGKGAEARLIAEDLVMRAPWERANVERLLRALVLCHDPEPEQTIANLLCEDSSFMVEDV
jgi:tetratricopeptide (TPR) repeat protein